MSQGWVVLLLAAAASLSCGGKSSQMRAEEQGGDAASGGTSAAGTSNRNVGGDSAGQAGAGGGAGASACVYDDDGPANIPVRIINATSAPLYLGPQAGCGSVPFFTVADAAGSLLSSPGFCHTSCQQLLSGMVSGCPSIACPVGPVLELAAGEDTLQLWNGLFTETEMLAPQCRPADDIDTCERVAVVRPGTFTFSVTAHRSFDCGPASCMTCTPSSTGGCTSYGGVPSGQVLSAETEVALDGSYGLAPGGMVNSVEIVFKE